MANYKKKVTLPAKNPLNALCEKRLQSSMFKWTSFYNFLEFHCKILNSFAIYRCKEVVNFLNCYLYAKKVMALCLRVQFFLANPVDVRILSCMKETKNQPKNIQGVPKKNDTI